MLGIIGFFTAVLSVTLFAVTFNRAFPLPQKRYNDALAFALYLLAGTFVLWGVAVSTNTPEFTVQAILIGEILLGVATIAMLNIVHSFGSLGNALAVMMLGLGLVYRHANVQVTAFVQDGLLHFNLQGGTRTVILGIVLLIWLPALLVLVRKVAATFPAIRPLSPALSCSFAFLAVLTAVFLAARRPFMIVALFVGIILVFLLGAVCNVLLGKALRMTETSTEKQKGKKRHGSK